MCSRSLCRVKRDIALHWDLQSFHGIKFCLQSHLLGQQRHFASESNTGSAPAAYEEPLAVPTFQVWGANTGVGKTLFSSGILNTARKDGKVGHQSGLSNHIYTYEGSSSPLPRPTTCLYMTDGAELLTTHIQTDRQDCQSRTTLPFLATYLQVLYLKPVQTGFPADSDARMVVKILTDLQVNLQRMQKRPLYISC